MATDSGCYFENQQEIEDRLPSSAPSGDYSITDPSGGKVYTFNPNTATLAQLMDFVATLAKDMVG